jgi:hypothetical protein
MLLVILESPYAGPDLATIRRNVAYARLCIADSLKRGEAPIASHLLYTQPGILRDRVPEERALGIAAGLAWRSVAQLTAVYTDLGVSPGMQAAIDSAAKEGRPVAYRNLPHLCNEMLVATRQAMQGFPCP